VIQRWLDQKQLAFGKQHDAAALNTILLPSLLKQQQNRIQRDLAQNLYRQYDHQFNLLSYAVNPRDAAQATVTARVQEVTQAFSQATSTAIAPPSKDDLTVRYDLIRQQGTWKIAKIQVVTVH
jgi:hypothetical protein